MRKLTSSMAGTISSSKSSTFVGKARRPLVPRLTETFLVKLTGSARSTCQARSESAVRSRSKRTCPA